MKRSIILLIAGLTVFQAFASHVPDTTQLKPKPVYGKEAKVITYILDNNHYRKINLNDSLSSVILDSYIKGLDNNKTYFTTADLQSFEKYREKLDDLIRAANVAVAYLIYNAIR